VRVHLDENLSSEIARLLRAGGVDAVSAHEARKRQLSDRAQLELAPAQDRVIVTASCIPTVTATVTRPGCLGGREFPVRVPDSAR